MGVRNLGISRGVQSTPSLNNISKMVPLSQVVMRMAVGMRLKWSSCNSFASGNLKSKDLIDVPQGCSYGGFWDRGDGDKCKGMTWSLENDSGQEG